MEKEFVTYEQALALKELGFDEPCFGWWFVDEKMLFIEKSKKSTSDNILQAPLKQQVLRWFREKYNILGSIYSNASGYLFEWHDSIGGTHRGWSEYEGPNDSGCWDSYEEAESACIDKLIELVKNN
jgi:hypothetical protein